MGVAESDDINPANIESEPDVPENDFIVLKNKFALPNSDKRSKNKMKKVALLILFL